MTTPPTPKELLVYTLIGVLNAFIIVIGDAVLGRIWRMLL